MMKRANRVVQRTCGPHDRSFESRRTERVRPPSLRAAVLCGALLACAATAALVAGGGAPSFRFEECDDCGIGAYEMAEGMGGGVAAADFDNDGDIDFFVPTAPGTPNQLYRNDGGGVFTDVAAAAGLDSTRSSRTALWFDIDGDWDLDLLVAGDDPDDPAGTYRLYRQTAGDGVPVFEDVTDASGLRQPLPPPIFVAIVHRGGMAAGDFDGDGALDLVTTLWNGYPQVFHNDGTGNFTEITESSNVFTEAAFSHQAVLFDVNNDGLLDIYIAVDFRENALWVNNGDLTFTDIAFASNSDNAWNDMGIALGDYDADGDFDLYITNIEAPGLHNVMLRNDTVGSDVNFTEVAQTLGVANGSWAWGATFIDADNDGLLDVAATNGWGSAAFIDDVSRFWRQTGDDAAPFEEISDASGFNDTEWGSCLISFDADRDGDLDLLQTCRNGPLRLLMNERTDGQKPNSLVVRPRMTAGANRFAIGATVIVEAGGRTQMRPITAGISYLGQEPAEAVFGLGGAAVIDRVEVRWPDGNVTCLTNVAPNQVLDVTDDAPPCARAADLTGDGVVDAADLLLLLAAWGPCKAACPADLDASGAVGFSDLLEMLLVWGGDRH